MQVQYMYSHVLYCDCWDSVYATALPDQCNQIAWSVQPDCLIIRTGTVNQDLYSIESLLVNEITGMNSTYSYSLQTTVRTCNVKTLNWIELKVLWYHPDTPWHIILNPDTSWHVPTHKSWHMWLFFKLFTYRYCIAIIGSLLCVQPHYLISATTFAWSYVLGFRFDRDSRGPYSTVHEGGRSL